MIGGKYIFCAVLCAVSCLRMSAAMRFDLSGIEIRDFYECKILPLVETGSRGDLKRFNYELNRNKYEDDLNPELWKRMTEIRDDWLTNGVDDVELMRVAEHIGGIAVLVNRKTMAEEFAGILRSAKAKEIDEEEKVARCEKLRERCGQLIWREDYADWCRRKCIHLFAGLLQRYFEKQPTKAAKFVERARITPGESNLLFSVTHQCDGSCCVKAWTYVEQRKDREFKDATNDAMKQ